MGRTSMRDVASTLDPLQSYNWDVIFPRLPGVANPRSLTYKCISTQIPGSQVEQVSLEAHGVKLNFAGKRVWTGRWECSFFETRDASTRSDLFGWLEFTRSWNDNKGSYKSEYAVTAGLNLYDDRPIVVQRVNLFGLFLLDLQDVTVDQTSSVVQYNASFSYDFTDS